MNTYVRDGKTWAKVADLKPWVRNPRDITRKEFNKLKTSLAKGQIHNLIINQDGVMLSGNMRLRAYVDMKVDEVWVELIETASERDMFDIAMRSNMSAGFTDEEKLVQLATDLQLTTLELDFYTVNLGEPKPINLVVNGPDFDDDDKELKAPEPKDLTCPECGAVFVAGGK